MECNVCGNNFTPNKDIHYVARDVTGIGFSTMSGQEAELYDAFDCPACGCQIIANVRKRTFERTSDDQEQGDLTDVQAD